MSVLALKNSPDRPECEGLGAVLCYDPYGSRMVRSFRSILASGHPIFVRLHGAAQYPTGNELAYLNDLEGHGVLIVGYDDERLAVLVADPWDNRWGSQRGGQYWLSYNHLAMVLCNGSTDCYAVAAPLAVEANISKDELGVDRLEVKVGFAKLDAIVMDLDNISLTNVDVTIVETEKLVVADVLSKSVTRLCPIGDMSSVAFGVLEPTSENMSVTLEIKAKVRGARPYEFNDEIKMRLVTGVNVLLTLGNSKQAARG